jgi:hypothetical protein
MLWNLEKCRDDIMSLKAESKDLRDELGKAASTRATIRSEILSESNSEFADLHLELQDLRTLFTAQDTLARSTVGWLSTIEAIMESLDPMSCSGQDRYHVLKL